VATWGTWGLLACNTALFAASQLVVEPLKRKRMDTAFRAAVTEQADRILEGLPSAEPQLGSAGAKPAPDGGTARSAERDAALLSRLADMEARREQAEARLAARLEALAGGAGRSAALALSAAPPSHARSHAHRAAAWRARLAGAWASLPPGPLTGARVEWLAGVAGVAAVGGAASGLLLVVISAAAGGR
jgi:hypothetical protein